MDNSLSAIDGHTELRDRTSLCAKTLVMVGSRYWHSTVVLTVDPYALTADGMFVSPHLAQGHPTVPTNLQLKQVVIICRHGDRCVIAQAVSPTGGGSRKKSQNMNELFYDVF